MKPGCRCVVIVGGATPGVIIVGLVALMLIKSMQHGFW